MTEIFLTHLFQLNMLKGVENASVMILLIYNLFNNASCFK